MGRELSESESRVQGSLVEGLTDEDVAYLDKFEGDVRQNSDSCRRIAADSSSRLRNMRGVESSASLTQLKLRPRSISGLHLSLVLNHQCGPLKSSCVNPHIAGSEPEQTVNQIT